jgi:hypothetical protein
MTTTLDPPQLIFPRLATYPEPEPGCVPDVTQPDPSRNAKDVRHDVKGHLTPIILLAYELRKLGGVKDEDAVRAAEQLEEAVAAVIRTIDLVRVLPPQPIVYTGPRPPRTDAEASDSHGGRGHGDDEEHGRQPAG